MSTINLCKVTTDSFSSVHDGDIAPLLSALDIMHDDELLPDSYVATNRNWQTSQVTPMGGRIIFERLSCHDQSFSDVSRAYVRLNINDGIVAIPGCAQGPGHSCLPTVCKTGAF